MSGGLNHVLSLVVLKGGRESRELEIVWWAHGQTPESPGLISVQDTELCSITMANGVGCQEEAFI